MQYYGVHAYFSEIVVVLQIKPFSNFVQRQCGLKPSSLLKYSTYTLLSLNEGDDHFHNANLTEIWRNFEIAQ